MEITGTRFDDVKRCTRCLLPETLKGITFDEEGICNYCRKYESDFAGWDKIADRKKQEFEKLLEAARKLNRSYDCLVPLSGGKDSTYVLYLCTKVYKLKCLAVTFDNGYLSDRAKTNIANAIRATSADHFFYRINKVNSEKLFATFVNKTGDFCDACMRGINYSIETAQRSFNIPLIIKGSGRRVQYLSQIRELQSLNTAMFFSKVIRGESIEPVFRHFSRNKYRAEFQKIAGGLFDIFGLKRTTLMRFTTQNIGMYDYIYKPFTEIVEILKQEMGWADEEGTIEHMDCYLHSVKPYRHRMVINNITTKTFHNSGLIRQGILTREEALKSERERYSHEQPPQELLDFLEKNNITLEKYRETVKNSDLKKYTPAYQLFIRRAYHSIRRW